MNRQILASYQSRKVAVTGASGYLANALLPELVRAKADVLRVSRQALSAAPGMENLRADVRKSGCWDAIFSFADIVFHFAGNTSVYAAEDDPLASLDSSLVPMLHMQRAASRVRRKPRVVFAGTATQYGITTVAPVSEDASCRPITNYDLHKLFAEQQLMLATQQGLLEGVSLRLANIYGPSVSESRSSDRGVINKAAAAAFAGQPLRLYGGGGYLRDYVFITDVIRAFLAAGLADGVAGRAFNVGSGVGLTVRDAFHQITEAAARITGRKVALEDVPWPAESHPIERRDFVADIRAIESAAGWSPEVVFAQGVARLIDELAARS